MGAGDGGAGLHDGASDVLHPALPAGRVLLLAFTFVGFPLAAYGLSYWLPTVVKGFGVSNTVNGFINVLPWLVTGVAL